MRRRRMQVRQEEQADMPEEKRRENRDRKMRLIRIRTDAVYGGVISGRGTENAALYELAASIALHGLLQPIVVRYNAKAGRYALICGARRLAACRLLGMEEIDALLADMDAQESAACFMEEHLLRTAPCPLDEAQALLAAKGAPMAEGAGISGRIAAIRRLALLDEETKRIVRRHGLSSEQASVLTAIKSSAARREAAMIIAQRELTPAQARRLVFGPVKIIDKKVNNRQEFKMK